MNMIGSAHHMGALGIQRGLEQIGHGAVRTAGAESLKGVRNDLGNVLVGMEEGKLQAQASAKVVRATDEVIGSLLNVTV